MAKTWRNWSGGVVAHPADIVRPSTEADIAAAVRAAAKVRVAGSGHSFTALCATDGVLLDLSAWSGVVATDRDAGLATVRAGTKIHALGRPLWEAGLALKNQGDIDRQSIAGALSTATHGTGAALPCLAAEIAAFRLVAADGAVLTCSALENPDVFSAGRAALGLFGVLSEVTLAVRPRYKLVQTEWVCAADDALQALERLNGDHRHFEFFWFPYADAVVAKALDETDLEAPEPRSSADMAARGEVESADQRAFRIGCETVRALPFTAPRAHRLFTAQAAGARKVRWSHELFPSPRTTRFNEMEYAVPAENGPECLREIVAVIRSGRFGTAFPIEYRAVAKDDLWISPFYGRASATLAVHHYHKQDPWPLFEACQAVFRRFGGRPHWGKMHRLTGDEARRLYPRFDDFVALRRRLDPAGKFLNDHLRPLFA